MIASQRALPSAHAVALTFITITTLLPSLGARPAVAQVPPGSVVMGVPAKVRREVTREDQDRIRHAAIHYVENARRFKPSESP